MNTPDTYCKKCKKVFSEDNVRYIVIPSGTKIPLSHCKDCETNINENFKRYHRENRSKVRIKILKLLGNKCKCCGLMGWWILVIDKIKYTKLPRELPHPLYRKLINNPDLLDEYQCLCMACDKSKGSDTRCKINHNLDKPKMQEDDFWGPNSS